ncbi:SprT family zinc-dependent metalloprotease [Luteimonas pelagia]
MPPLRRLLAPTPAPDAPDALSLALADGRVVEVARVRHPRARRLRLSVDERGARLTLPPRASLASGDRFVAEHREWIARQLERFALEPGDPLRPGGTASLPLRGIARPLSWREGRFTRVAEEGDGLVFHVTGRAGHGALVRALRDFYAAEARADVGRWMPRYLAGLPRSPRQVRLKVMSSQWGSLSPDGTVALDLALVLAPPAAFEYVLVHELCHLVRADHSPAYWREVDARCPGWRVQREWFRANGRQLKASLRALLAHDPAG